MKLTICGAAALLITSGSALAAPEDPSASVSGTGEGAWEVLCHVTPEAGSDFVRFLKPSRASFAGNVRRATCTYKSSSKGPLTITVVPGSALACPFPAAADGACAQTFNASGAGDFELRRKRP